VLIKGELFDDGNQKLLGILIKSDLKMLIADEEVEEYQQYLLSLKGSSNETLFISLYQ
jgi:hypothetical protein